MLCAGCPHRGLYYAIKPFKPYVSGDIGCYTLGASAPLSMMDACVCMGASVSALHGFNTARGKEQARRVAGRHRRLDVHPLGHHRPNRYCIQQGYFHRRRTRQLDHRHDRPSEQPRQRLTIKGDPTSAVDLEALARAVGIRRVRVVDPFDVEGTRKAIGEELEAEEPSLVISRRPCALLKSVKPQPALRVEDAKCVGCKACLTVGCPAISFKDGKAVIDSVQCLGCGVCAYACRTGALVRSASEERR